MKQWVCIIMLVTLASMHGIFEAAGSLSIIKNMQQDAPIASYSEDVNAQCCDDDIIEISTVAFHCPIDGKILTSGIETKRHLGKQVHFSCEASLVTAISSTSFFRPPIA